ncbi:hypothetical protein G4228_019293 [Cervus hanglu yarkandensis]|nr:hypothetical protein G4228_019293 [Cervus hanglu yarkandensis]
MANSANTNTVPKLYRSVIEDVINDVRDIFLNDGNKKLKKKKSV